MSFYSYGISAENFYVYISVFLFEGHPIRGFV